MASALLSVCVHMAGLVTVLPCASHGSSKIQETRTWLYQVTRRSSVILQCPFLADTRAQL